MDSLILSTNAIAPIFLMMLVGYVIKQTGLASKSTLDGINKLVFKIFLPTLLFYNIYSTESLENFSWKILLFTVVSVSLVFLIGLGAVFIFTKVNEKRSVLLQALFRSNFAILGIPLINSICGDKTSGLTYLMVAIVVPLFNILAVASFLIFGKGGNTFSIKAFIKGLVTNPIIIGCALGLVFFGLGIKLPFILEKAVSDVSKITTPLSIIVLGAGFTVPARKSYFKEVILSVGARLIIVPVLMVSAAVLCGFRGEALACLLIAAGAPAAVSSYSTAQVMGGDGELAAQIVVVSSALCILSLFGWIYILSGLGLF